MQPTLTCQDSRRERTVRHHGHNGIDCVEVAENGNQTELSVRLFGRAPEPATVKVLIEGGRRIRDIRVRKLWVDHDAEDRLRLTVDRPGDFSFYTLRIVAAKDGRPTDQPPPGFDVRYTKARFSFKVNCPSDLDCKSEAVCPPEEWEAPEINYLAKDYASFRQLILDRLAVILPHWQERHVPDIGMALVEVLAYVGDYLSYYQDAVATEAYLSTARRRISIRRHARLVDYELHEGCNARTWVSVETDQDITSQKLRDIYFMTDAERCEGEVFEPLIDTPDAPLRLYASHGTLYFYTWGDELCCLPKGATKATLKYDWASGKAPEPNPTSHDRKQQPAKQCPPPAPEPPAPQPQPKLEPGDVLILEEVKGPRTGHPADADPAHRWAVRLTAVVPGLDTLYDPPVPVLEIEWDAEDALPFALCLSARRPAPDCDVIHDVSIARGNVILVDHGKTIEGEDLGQVESGTLIGECECEDSAVEVTYVPRIFGPFLKQTPLTFSEPLSHDRVPASHRLKQDPRKALPQITLIGLPGMEPQPDGSGEPKPREGIDPGRTEWHWRPRRDLLGSQREDQHFVVEIGNDGLANLRFGDGELGRVPEAFMIFSARYRAGNGPAGNVGADTITKAGFRNQSGSGLTLRVRNPLPAQGGTPAEPTADVKLFAPGAFRKGPQRAVTAADYARLAEHNDKIQRAGASLRWNGSWYEAHVAIDARGTEEPAESLLREIERYLERYRRIGHDLRVVAARRVPLDIAMDICVLPHYLRGHVEAALLELFSRRRLADGRLGFFHPDNLTFGEGIFVSKLVATAQAVPGVESVTVSRLRRFAQGDNGELAEGILRLGPLEIAQLNNDPSFPEHGKLTLNIGGGR